MSWWQYQAAVEGYRSAHSSEEAPPPPSDEEFEQMLKYLPS